ncbi:hypothetical protein [Caulobacter sp. S45]|uniref:hypothetical protein n=1 Tax=Caulobacter sp. S45 TaxID=1641861 RepID=UPI00157720A0|nr:hypothetical protein [Caulobacter sp. S45]
MAVADMLPTMDDKALESLKANALRLQDEPEGARQKQAEMLLPLIEAELAEREARKPPKPVRVVRKKAPAGVKAA